MAEEARPPPRRRRRARGARALPERRLAQAAIQRGTLVTVPSDADDVDDAEAARPPPSPAKTDAIVFERFNLHANVRIAAEDDTGRERLCRYITRPPFALGRFRRLRDGSIAYRVKKVSRHRATERVMEPVECLARLQTLNVGGNGFSRQLRANLTKAWPSTVLRVNRRDDEDDEDDNDERYDDVDECIANKFRGARVPRFTGAGIKVGTSFVVN